jgi:hypothetical protein
MVAVTADDTLSQDSDTLRGLWLMQTAAAAAAAAAATHMIRQQ